MKLSEISFATKHNDINKKLGWTERIGFGIGDFSYNLIYQPLSAFLLIYYTNVVGVSPAAAASVVAISKVLDAISDIIMGSIVDNTHTKAGQARPWILRMAIPLAVCFVLMFSVPQAFGGMARIAWMFITYNMVTTICYTGGNLPYSTLLSLITGNQQERGTLSTIRLIFAVAAQLGVNAMVLKLVRVLGNGETYDQTGWTKAAIVLGIMSIILTVFSYAATKERNNAVKEDKSANPVTAVKSLLHNKYWIIMFIVCILSYALAALHLGSMTYYAQYNLGDVDYYPLMSNCIQGVELAGLIIIAPIVMKKYGKHLTYQAGTLITLFGYVICIIFSNSYAGNCAGNIIKGFGLSCTASMIYALIADTIDYGEWKTGIQCAGMGNAAAGFGMKIGGALGTWVWGLILGAGGFSSDLETQTSSALSAIKITYMWLPLILMVLTFIAMCFYKLDKEYDTISAELAERRKNADKAK